MSNDSRSATAARRRRSGRRRARRPPGPTRAAAPGSASPSPAWRCRRSRASGERRRAKPTRGQPLLAARAGIARRGPARRRWRSSSRCARTRGSRAPPRTRSRRACSGAARSTAARAARSCVGVGVGVQERDRDRVDAGARPARAASRSTYATSSACERRAVGQRALRHVEAQVARHERLAAARARGRTARSGARGRSRPRRGSRRVASSAVRAPLRSMIALVTRVVPWIDLVDRGRPRRRARAASRAAPSRPPRRVVGRRQRLADRERARRVVDEDQVGEGAADVHADPPHQRPGNFSSPKMSTVRRPLLREHAAVGEARSSRSRSCASSEARKTRRAAPCPPASRRGQRDVGAALAALRPPAGPSCRSSPAPACRRARRRGRGRARARG